MADGDLIVMRFFSPSPASRVISRAFAVLVGVAMFAGCATADRAKPGTRFVVTAQRAGFYKYGPAQNFGPDYHLTKGQKLTLVTPSFGFSRFTTDDGVGGYVSNDELAVAPPEPKPTPVPAARNKLAAGKPKRSDVKPTPGAPLFDINDVPAPLPQDPSGEPRPAPGFRF